MNRFVFSALMVMGTSLALAQDNTPLVRLAPIENSFVEKYDKSVDVAGQLRAGLMYGSASGDVVLDELTMDLTADKLDTGAKVCMRVASRNGEFSATWKVAPTVGKKERIQLDFPTEHRSVLEKMKVDELVAIASVVTGDMECTHAQRRYVPTSWGPPVRSTITAYLNADSTEALIAGKFASGEIEKNNCLVLSSDDDNTAFDTICMLHLPATDDQPQIPAELVVLRKNYSTVMKNISYVLTGL